MRLLAFVPMLCVFAAVPGRAEEACPALLGKWQGLSREARQLHAVARQREATVISNWVVGLRRATDAGLKETIETAGVIDETVRRILAGLETACGASALAEENCQALAPAARDLDDAVGLLETRLMRQGRAAHEGPAMEWRSTSTDRVLVTGLDLAETAFEAVSALEAACAE